MAGRIAGHLPERSENVMTAMEQKVSLFKGDWIGMIATLNSRIKSIIERSNSDPGLWSSAYDRDRPRIKKAVIELREVMKLVRPVIDGSEEPTDERKLMILDLVKDWGQFETLEGIEAFATIAIRLGVHSLEADEFEMTVTII